MDFGLSDEHRNYPVKIMMGDTTAQGIIKSRYNIINCLKRGNIYNLLSTKIRY